MSLKIDNIQNIHEGYIFYDDLNSGKENSIKVESTWLQSLDSGETDTNSLYPLGGIIGRDGYKYFYPQQSIKDGDVLALKFGNTFLAIDSSTNALIGGKTLINEKFNDNYYLQGLYDDKYLLLNIFPEGGAGPLYGKFYQNLVINLRTQKEIKLNDVEVKAIDVVQNTVKYQKIREVQKVCTKEEISAGNINCSQETDTYITEEVYGPILSQPLP